eukprot:1005752-Alexandrium_andersonii.AAC.1
MHVTANATCAHTPQVDSGRASTDRAISRNTVTMRTEVDPGSEAGQALADMVPDMLNLQLPMGGPAALPALTPAPQQLL